MTGNDAIKLPTPEEQKPKRMGGPSGHSFTRDFGVVTPETMKFLPGDPLSSGFKFSSEVRVTDPDTGAEKGSKDERFDLIPTGPLAALARHYGVGARKYSDHNWAKGYNWSLSYAALQRHANAFWDGEEIDEETGSNHMAAVAFHAFALLEFCETNRDKDDRWATTKNS